MKHILPFFILFFTITNIHAQDIIVSSTDTVCVTAAIDNSDVIAHTFVQNNTRSSMNLVWKLTNFGDQPAGWETAVCDNNQCYPPFVLTNVIIGGNPDLPVELNTTDSSIIDMHLYPDEIAGTGHTQVCFATRESIDEILGCMTYKFTVGNSSSVTTTQLGDLEVFPNPTTEYFGLTNNGSIKEIQVYNMLGRKQRVFEAALGKKYYVGDMPAGMYLVAFLDKDGKIEKTTRLVKRFYRP